MLGVAEETEKDESSRHGSVQAAQEDDGGDHERKGRLLVYGLEGAKGGRRDVLVTSVSIYNGSDDAKDDDFGNCACPECLGEVPKSY